jgi:hypothetical protein|tara:strand:+ start:971 stop:1480 length:510 start_codon:yes stop_codon:yes gene_type:complete
MSDIYENDTDESTEESVVDKRAPRDVDERKDDTRPNDAFIPQSLLPIPEPQDGWVFRWIRTSILGESDNINVSTRFREGWEPVMAEEHPELKIQSDYGSQFAAKGNIEIGGLLLCKAPEKTMQQRSKYYEDMAQQQMEGVDRNYLRENDPRMPLLRPERTTKVKFGGNN